MATCILHKVDFEDKCPECTVPSRAKLADELVRLYNLGIPAKVLYISDLSNNLAKIHQYMNENVDFTLAKPVSITLTTIEGLPRLQTHYDIVFIDHVLNGIVPVEAFTPEEARVVHGTSQEIL